jgi:hypothetical protein
MHKETSEHTEKNAKHLEFPIFSSYQSTRVEKLLGGCQLPFNLLYIRAKVVSFLRTLRIQNHWTYTAVFSFL